MKKTRINGELYDFHLKNEVNAVTNGKEVRDRIEAEFGKHNLIIKLGTDQDIERVQQLQTELFHPHTAMLETGYELFRIIRNGYLILIEHADGRLLGFYSTIYYHLLQKEGYGVRVGMHPQVAGYNFAALLAKYAISLAVDNGCSVFRALMSPINLRSASNVLNHIGYYCEKLHEDIPSMGARFEIVLPLSSSGLSNQQIDLPKIVRFVHERKQNEDFMLVEPTDNDGIRDMYLHSDFKIIAFLKKGSIDDDCHFFAVKIAC